MMKNIVLLAILTLAIRESSGSEPLFVVAHWTFEEAQAGEAAVFNQIVDVSGNDHHGLPINAPVYIEAPRGTALSFDGNRQLVYVQDHPQFRFATFTLEAWIYPEPSFRDQLILFRGDQQDGRDPFFINLRDRKLQFGITDRQFGGASLAYDLPSLNDWYHIACAFDEMTRVASMYVNSRLVAQALTNVDPLLELDPASFPGLAMANAQDPSYSRFFHGAIDEVRVSSRALVPMPEGFSIFGDVNADGIVGIQDLNAVRNSFGNSADGDVDGDGQTGIADLNFVRNEFGQGGTRLVAEPSSIAIAAMAVMSAFAVWRIPCSTARRRATASP